MSRDPESILDAAAREIIRHGYAASSLSSIAARLGLTKGALARQFPSKDQLAYGIVAKLVEVIDNEASVAAERYPAGGIRALLLFLAGMGQRWRDDPQPGAAIVLFTDRTSPVFGAREVGARWVEHTGRFVEAAYRAGEIDSTVDVRDLTEHLLLSTIGRAVLGNQLPDSADRQLVRLIRFSLIGAGVADADQLVDEVLAEADDPA